MFKQELPLHERFWLKVDKTPGHGPKGDCWLWTGSTTEGYGDIKVIIGGRKRTEKATHVMWFLCYGVWPTQMLLHSCDTRACINPAHVSEGNAKRNMQECIERGRRGEGYSLTHCPKGHLYDEANTYQNPGGYRMCRACQRERQNASRRALQIVNL
jgi:hypothetical protein